MNLTYFKAQPILLKDHAFFTEKWLQDCSVSMLSQDHDIVS
jgi:hypothetical protein